MRTITTTNSHNKILDKDLQDFTKCEYMTCMKKAPQIPIAISVVGLALTGARYNTVDDLWPERLVKKKKKN